MKKLTVAIMVLMTLVSCGKDNKVASKAAAATSPVTTAITVADQVALDLGTKIDQYTTYFGTQQINYYTTIGSVANQGVSIKYKYTKQAASASSGNGCETKWVIFTYCTQTSMTTFNPTLSRTVENSGVNIPAKIAELKALINSKHPAYPVQVNGTSYHFVTTDNKAYVIDLRLPIQAQPTGIKNGNETEYLFRYDF